MLELAGTDLRVDAARVDAIARHGARQMRGLRGRVWLRVWRGLRPCTPDGLPIVGPVPGMPNATLATGHGMWGLQLASVTGRLVAALVEGTNGSLPGSARLDMHGSDGTALTTLHSRHLVSCAVDRLWEAKRRRGLQPGLRDW
jgi:glycine/D-amino acid oxidase-like deaminating enzyme